MQCVISDTIENVNEIREYLQKFNGISKAYFADKNVYINLFDDDNNLIGHAEVWRLNWIISELHHLFVMPKYRGNGYGRILFEKQMEITQTPFAMMTVRKDNEAMLHLAFQYDFDICGEYSKVYLLMRGDMK